MGRRHRQLPYPNAVLEVSWECLHRRPLLSGPPPLRDRLYGVLGRALALYPLPLYGLAVQPAALRLLLAAPNAALLANFSAHLGGNAAREAGRLNNWWDKFWRARYQAQVLQSEVEIVECFRRMVRQADPELHRALIGDRTLSGSWIDRAALAAAPRLGRILTEDSFATEYPVPLAPLPPWAHLTPSERRAAALLTLVPTQAQQVERLRCARRGPPRWSSS